MWNHALSQWNECNERQSEVLLRVIGEVVTKIWFYRCRHVDSVELV